MAYHRSLTDEQGITQAARERIDEFRVKIIQLLHNDGMSRADLALDCELDYTTLSNFLTRIRAANGLTLMKLSIGTGIPL